MLKIKNLQKNIAGSPVQLDVSMELHPGEIVGLFGENGAGKTTLMKCIFGFTSSKGQVLLDGEPLSHKNIGKLSFATCEHSFFPGLTAEGHREFYEAHFSTFRRKRYDVLMDFFGLSRSTALKNMSTGEQNQFEVIMALCQGAEYIFMDEPFVGNDIFNREDFYRVLLGMLEENETIILSTHLIEEVDHFISRALLIKEGKIIGETTVDELEEQGITLVDYVKKTYGYESDRVLKALEKMEQ